MPANGFGSVGADVSDTATVGEMRIVVILVGVVVALFGLLFDTSGIRRGFR